MPESGIEPRPHQPHEHQQQDRCAALLRELNISLHELSQPITVLLCTLEYGAELESMDEIKKLLLVAREASERLRRTAVAMQGRIALEDA